MKIKIVLAHTLVFVACAVSATLFGMTAVQTLILSGVVTYMHGTYIISKWLK